MAGYREDLEKQIKAKQKELDLLYEERSDTNLRENFWHVQDGINKTTVDLATLKSRLENYGRRGINLPDTDNVNTINKYT